MPDFEINDDGTLAPIPEVTGLVEKDTQKLIEKNMDVLLRLKFLKSEYSTGKMHGGRIDTLCVDESVPLAVIIEYKNKPDVNVIIQGFYYFGWVLDHKDEIINFAKKKGIKNADNIDVKKTRIVCIAPKFSKEEIYMVTTLNTWFQFDIQLLTFSRAGKKFNMKTVTHPTIPVCKSNGSARPLQRAKTKLVVDSDNKVIDDSIMSTSPVKAVVTRLKTMDWEFHNLFNLFVDYALSFNDIEMHDNTEYVGFRKLYNLFVVRGYDAYIKMTLDLYEDKDSALLELIEPYCQAYSEGQMIKKSSKYKKDAITLEFLIKTTEDLEKVFPVVKIMCENN